ncbi:Uncharacterized protein Adt_18762 [Abeliophyllum distichum]|uniref:Mediator of RNA polymerase II transcription subunit 19a n=1 Tax=Abeliophyllum distichum TaxID=126358 RepID=A0ABD1TKA1_9LAMI
MQTIFLYASFYPDSFLNNNCSCNTKLPQIRRFRPAFDLRQQAPGSPLKIALPTPASRKTRFETQLMDPDSKKFGRGPRELTGALDLISLYKLLPQHAFFCKRSRPGSISDTHYLYNVVGDTEIRKGEGMQLNQLIQDTFSRDSTSSIKPFDLSLLGEAFRLNDAASVDLPPSEKGTATVAGKSKGDSNNKEKRKKHKEKDKEHKKHKHRHKDRSKEKDKEKKKDKSGRHDSGTDKSKKHREKKRKHDENGDINDIQRHKKNVAVENLRILCLLLSYYLRIVKKKNPVIRVYEYKVKMLKTNKGY